ncbi:MAG: DNA polymerase Y family protein [Acidimicrobiales bacterium]
MRAVVVWCPDWPVTAAGFGPDETVAVVDGGRVVAASGVARAAGVAAGLRRREAESRCPGLVVRGRDPALEARAYEPVVAAVSALVPELAVIRPGLLAFDGRGPTRFVGGEPALCDRLVELVEEALFDRDHPAPSVGIADGRFAATWAARCGEIVPPGASAEFLAPFPVTTLGLPDLADLLARLGITTLGAFAQLPTAAVSDRFGAVVARVHARVRGVDEALVTRAEVEPIEASTTLDPPADRAETASFAARGLAAELLAQLSRRGLGCTRVRIEAATAHGEVLARSWTGGDLLDADAIVDRLRWQLAGWLSGTTEPGPTAGVARLAVAAEEVVAGSGTQLALWGGLADVDRRAMRGLDRLRGMLGPGAVLLGAVAGGRSPAERAVLVPWGEDRPAGLDPHHPWPGHHPPPAPVIVYPDPLPATVTDAEGLGVTVSGRGRSSAPLAVLAVAGSPAVAIEGWAGPWTTDERWWSEQARRRFAGFQVVTADSRAHLCRVSEGRWWVEATYD